MKHNKYGNPLCPFQKVVSDWDDEGEHRRHWLELCEADLYLERGGTFGLFDGMKAEDADWQYALSSDWKVVCSEGHVLLASGGADDHPPPFVPAWLASL